MKSFLKEWRLLIINCGLFAVGLTTFIADLSESDLLYKDLTRTVVEKKMFSARASKGRVYDDAYIKVKSSTGSQWIGVHTESWLNTEVGDRFTERVAKNSTTLTFVRVLALIAGLLWSCGAAWSITKNIS
jgi:hypothetical protein